MDGPKSQKLDGPYGVLVPKFFGSRHAYGFGNALPTSKAPPGPPWVRTVLKTEFSGLSPADLSSTHGGIMGFNMNHLYAKYMGIRHVMGL